jgi:uncharacterized protein (DUF1697 family)
MPVLISLLRGVNVGGHGKIKMDALRDLYVSLKLEDPKTYVQSGNVVFRSRSSDLPKIAARIQSAIEQNFQVRTAIILRTVEEWRAAMARNPFASRNLEPAKILVTFLASEPRPEALKKALAVPAALEELHILGREAYTYFPNGMGQSKFNWAAVERALGIPVSGRNWNSVVKILELAESLEA